MTAITVEMLRSYFLGVVTSVIVGLLIFLVKMVYDDKMEKLDKKIEKLEDTQ